VQTGRINWYLRQHQTSWRRLTVVGLWGGFLFLLPNFGWFLGLGMKGVLPSEASAVANSSFAWVYLLSLMCQ
jgi:hypothetical protein